MKILGIKSQNASVLIVAMLTITIMTLICATSLLVIGQNAGGGMQTAGWQQSMTAAESGVDVAIRALNTTISGSTSSKPWTTGAGGSLWYSANGSLPTSGSGYSYEPTGGTAIDTSTATPPDTSHYYYLPSSAMPMNLTNTEGATSTKFWVTVDTAGTTALNPSGSSQWYRIRSTGQTTYPANSVFMHRLFNNRLDNDLRNTIALVANKNGATYTNPTITRTVETIVQPTSVSTSTTTNPFGGKGMYLKNALTMSGGGSIGHYNSSFVSTNTFITSPTTYRSTDYTETLVGLMNANGSNLANAYIYGGMSYSTTGSAPQNTKNVEGAITSPFTATPPTTSDPSWAGTPDITYSGGGSLPFNTIGAPNATYNSEANAYKVKINGNFTVPGGKTLTFTSPNGGASPTYIDVWVTGSFTTSGSGYITQPNGVHVTYYVDGSVTTSGGSFNNQSGFAGNTQFIVVGNGSVTCSGSSNMIATIEAPNSAVTVSGTGLFIGSLIGSTMNISGGASYYYDDYLTNYTGGAGNITTTTTTNSGYAFASWFEDNADPTRKSRDVNNALHPIVY